MPTSLFALLCISFTSIIKNTHTPSAQAHPTQGLSHTAHHPHLHGLQGQCHRAGSGLNIFYVCIVSDGRAPDDTVMDLIGKGWCNIQHPSLSPVFFFELRISVSLSLQGSEDSSVHPFHFADTEMENIPLKNAYLPFLVDRSLSLKFTHMVVTSWCHL